MIIFGGDSCFAKRLLGLQTLLPLLFFMAAVETANAADTTMTKIPHCLKITDFRTQKSLGRWQLTEPYFALSFIHSVSETPVVDYYTIDKQNNIIQTSERFEHHGAGLPSNVSEGSGWQKHDGYFWLTMQRPIPQLIVRTDKDYKNRLHLGRQLAATDSQLSIDLNQWQDGALWLQPLTCPNAGKTPLP